MSEEASEETTLAAAVLSVSFQSATLLNAASAPRRPRPARPIPACICAKSSRVSPACAAAASVASMMDRQAFSKPIRVVAGPELAPPSTLPFSSSIRARQRVPPPSMPRYVVPFVPMES